jgi:hypothetical protein
MKINMMLKKLGMPFVMVSGFLLLTLGLAGCGYSTSQSAVVVPASTNGEYNYEDLDMYGQWETMEPYGNVWRPDVGPDWRPFYYGKWIYTDEGWAWESYERFGWIVYHYGDWLYTQEYGWVWIPGDVWSPARVQWMQFDGEIAWAPLTPPGVEIGEPWEQGPGINFWLIVNSRNFTRDDVGRYRIHRGFERREFEHSEIFRRPPERRRIEQFEGRRIEPVPIQRHVVRTPRGELRKNQYPPKEHRRIEKRQGELDRHVLRPNPRRVEERRHERENQQDRENRRSEENHRHERREAAKEKHHDRH